jgi:hypothetical protein
MVREEEVPRRRFSTEEKKQTKMKLVAKTNSIATLAVLAAAVVILPTANVLADEIDLTAVGVDAAQTVHADFGGDGLVANFHTQPAGTGVFDPFLTIERDASGGNPAGVERGYNTDGVLYLDQQRPAWNQLVKLSDLAVIDVNGGSYYAFELDANEPGADKSLLSIDNVRIYTSTGDNTLFVQSDESNLDSLGNLRWAMNHPLTPGGTDTNPGNYNIDNWIKLDSNQSDVDARSNGGSGISDMILYVPTSAFEKAIEDGEDYLWFYNLNGVHYNADPNGDPDLAAEAGYEEWRAVTGPNQVPDGGNTLVLFGTGLAALGMFGRRKLATVA